MRLTLRTLLAYLDDTLDPEQARDIGRKVAQSDVAQALIERIKTVTRRRRLKAPPVASDDPVLDPNTIAEYLDNVLPSDELVQLEESAQSSDPLLAEIAACHQILTLVLGEPAKVPPTARQRMYRLVRGRESIPYRKPAAATVAGVADPEAGHDAGDADETLLLGLPAFSRHQSVSRRLIPVAGIVLLLAGLLAAIWLTLPSGTPPQTPATYIVAGPVSRPVVPPAPIEQAKGKGEPAKTEVAKGEPAKKDAEVARKQDEVPAKVVDKKETIPAPRPEAGPEPRPAGGDGVAGKQPLVAGPPKPSPDRVAVGEFDSRARDGKDAVLLTRTPEGDGWQRVAGVTPKVFSTDPLVALPGYHPEVRLDSGVRLQFWGNLPDFMPMPLLETRVTLYAPQPGFAADFRLDGGRVFIGNLRKQGPVRVRVRFQAETCDITLPDGASEVCVDLFNRYEAGVPFSPNPGAEAPKSEFYLAVLKGRAGVRHGFQEFPDLPAPTQMSWDNKGPGWSAPGKIDPEGLAFWSKAVEGKVPNLGELEAALADFSQRLARRDAALEVEFASAVSGEGEKWSRRYVGVLFLQAINALPYLADALADDNLTVRQAAVLALQHWVGQAPGRDLEFYRLLVDKKRYPDNQAEQVLQLLHRFSRQKVDDPVTYATLFDLLNHERVAVRELAYWHLAQMDPAGAKEVGFFDSSAPNEIRLPLIDKWKASWKHRFLDKKK